MTTVTNASRSDFLFELFRPAETNDESVECEDKIDLISNYLDTSDGVQTLFLLAKKIAELVNHSLDLLSRQPSIIFDKINQTASAADAILSFPSMLKNLNDLRHSISDLTSLRNSSETIDSLVIARGIKQAFMDVVNFVNNGSQCLSFAHSAEIIEFSPRNVKIFDSLNSATAIVIDGVELCEKYVELSSYALSEGQTQNAEEIQKLSEKKTLAWIVVAKNVSSIVGAALTLLGLAEGVSFAATLGLGFGAVWLSMKIAEHFYKVMVVDAPQTEIMQPA